MVWQGNQPERWAPGLREHLKPDTGRAPRPGLQMPRGQALCYWDVVLLLRAALI